MDQISKVFQGLGIEGALLFACILLVFLFLKALKDKDNFAQMTQNNLVQVIKTSTAAHMSVAIVLSRIEAQLGLPTEPWLDKVEDQS